MAPHKYASHRNPFFHFNKFPPPTFAHDYDSEVIMERI